MLDANTSEDSGASSPSEAQLRQAIEYLYYAYRSFTERPDKILEKRGLGRVHHRILYFVGRNPGTTVNALLATLQVSKQALNAPLRQLLAMQLIDAQIAPHDGRVRHLSLTRSGSKLEAQLSGTQMEQLRQAFEAAGPQARAGWNAVMSALLSQASVSGILDQATMESAS
jgi:DNA-binding MarR family transcriptional regulator